MTVKTSSSDVALPAPRRSANEPVHDSAGTHLEIIYSINTYAKRGLQTRQA